MYGSPSPPRAAGTAKILILIGLILQAIEVAVFVLIALILVVVPFVGVFLFLPLAAVGILWIILVYFFSYERVDRGDYAGAQTPTLVFGILSLITFNLISGILYIVAYVEIGSAEREVATARGGYPGVPPTWGAPPPSSFSPGAAGAPPKYCPSCGRPNPAVSRFCQGCGAAFP